MVNYDSSRFGALPIDTAIGALARDSPGIAQSAIVRALMAQWSAVYIRQRIEALGARGAIRVERGAGGRLYVHPVTAGAIEA